jgi:NTE family protein
MAKRIGIAFGGGGARGLAHIGVIRAIRTRAAALPTIVAGTSAGSIAAVLYAAGLPQAELEQIAGGFDWFRHVIKFSDTVRGVIGQGQRGGLVSNAALGETVNALIGGRGFDELPVDVAVVATDLERRRRVIFTSASVASRLDRRELERFLAPPAEGMPGCDTVVISDVTDVGLAVRASCAVPGIFLPVEVRGMHLVDGGLVDQVPVDVVRAMGALFTVGVSLAMGYSPERITRPAAAISGMVGLMGLQLVRRSLDLADVGFQISGIETRSLVDTHQLDLIERGERDAEEHLGGKLWRARRRARLSPASPERLPALR